MPDTVMLWFKNDLRLHDNEALVKAVASGAKVLPVYCFDSRLFSKLELGFRKSDLTRFRFARQCVSNLRKNLQRIGGDLKILIGKPEEQIAQLVQDLGCKAIFAEREYATEELNVIEALNANLPENCSLDLYWGKTLYHLDDIPYSIGEIPLTSKAYRINTTKNTKVRETFKKPERADFAFLQDWGELPEPVQLGFEPALGGNVENSEAEDEFNLDSEASSKKDAALLEDRAVSYEKASPYNYKNSKPYVEGGETMALERLQEYSFGTELLTGYRWSRNRSLGMDYSSKFSPYMALGCISPRTIYWKVKHYEKEVKKNQSTWWLIFEIVWRDYFTFKLMRFQNEVYHTGGIKEKETQFENDRDLFARWCLGKTGIPFVDAHMRQLNTKGYMSNRGRVNCASFLIHDYKVDWTWGASYFESKLIDYDVSSNWMNWHYQAFTSYYTNPVHQSLKYKADDYIREYIEELVDQDSAYVHAPWLLPENKFQRLDYPAPVEIYKKWQRSINNIQKKARPAD